MVVNLNDKVKVKLTRLGEQVLAAQHEEMREKVLRNSGKDMGVFVLRVDEQGYYETQLWILLDRFKEYIGLTCNNVFLNNNLYFEDIYNTRG